MSGAGPWASGYVLPGDAGSEIKRLAGDTSIALFDGGRSENGLQFITEALSARTYAGFPPLPPRVFLQADPGPLLGVHVRVGMPPFIARQLAAALMVAADAASAMADVQVD